MNLDRNLLTEKWSPILEHSKFDSITDEYKKKVTAVLLENQTNYLAELHNVERDFASGSQSLLTEAPTNATGADGFTSAHNATGPNAGYDPVLISLIRRSTPQLMAFDVCGVQPMTAPSQLIFALRSLYGTDRDPATAVETFYNEVNTGHASGKAAQTGENPGLLNALADGPDGDNSTAGDNEGAVTGNLENNSVYSVLQGYGTDTLEDLGDGTAFREMSISIEKHNVVAKARALKAQYSLELAQDMKAIHGRDAEQELASTLSTEIMAEINREVIRTIYIVAKTGAQTNTNQAGYYDLDVDSTGRWGVEKFKGLHFQIEKECNAIGQETRRGKGNFIICSANVASALAMTGVLDFGSNPRFKNSTLPNDTQSTLAGVLNGGIKVYVDPYSANVSDQQYFVAGYKGSSPYDAGIFYCPYVPLQKVRAVDPETFQPKIGFKTRYGMTAHPHAEGLSRTASGRLQYNTNTYYRRVRVGNVAA